MKTDVLNTQDNNVISHTVDILNRGGMVAFPTDTVYGLATLVSDGEGIERLYAVKGRQHTKAIALLLPSYNELSLVAEDISPNAIKLAKAFWPGALTLVLSKQRHLPPNLSPLSTIGVRVPNHPFALALLKKTGPLAVTSANLSGENSPVTAGDVLRQLEGRIHLVLDGGETPGQVASTVVDMLTDTPTILREGPISLEDIQKAITEA